LVGFFFQGCFLGGHGVPSYVAPFVSCFVHTLRFAGMTFNNICRFKKKEATSKNY